MVRALPLVLCLAFASAPSRASQEPGKVTIHNRTGFKLNLHLSTGDPGALRVKAGSSAPFQLALGEGGGNADFQVNDGESTTLKAERGDLDVRLVFWRQDAEAGAVFHGTVDYVSALRRTAAGGEERTGALALVPGPTPRTRVLAQNRNLVRLSETELELH
jgi:hypothetical protein